MPILRDYHHFDGTHWETGSVHNYYAYRGVMAPHTGEPYSEALLLGVSGGVVMGYFTFAYEGYDPQCNILTRNTFDPMDTMLSRLGVVQSVQRTAKPQRAEALLIDTLEEGLPAIVWADTWGLPYNGFREDEGMWGMMPLVVYGYDVEEETVYIADRSQLPLSLSTDELATGRARVKKEKHRLLTLDVPDPDKLASAVRLGIWDCIKLFTEKPPRGSKNNFGLAAFQTWAKILTQPKQRRSWEKLFPPGVEMYAGLTSAYHFAFLFGKGLAGDAERSRYADFLEEAALLLDKPALSETATDFRKSASAWRELPERLLPDDVPPFAEARELMWQHHELFIRQGQAALEERRSMKDRLRAIRDSMVRDFPLTQPEVVALREALADQLIAIHDAEQCAIETLRAAME